MSASPPPIAPSFTTNEQPLCCIRRNLTFTLYRIHLYNVGMLDSHGNPVSDWYPNVPVNNPVNFRYLIPGEEYHFVVSSSDVPEKGCTAVYEVY